MSGLASSALADPIEEDQQATARQKQVTRQRTAAGFGKLPKGVGVFDHGDIAADLGNANRQQCDCLSYPTAWTHPFGGRIELPPLVRRGRALVVGWRRVGIVKINRNSTSL